MELRYDYSLKQISSNTIDTKQGNEEKISIIYNPIKYDNFEVQFNFSKEINTGNGFNEIQKDILFQTTNESIELNVIPRNDEIYLSSLNLNINIPNNISPIIEKISFTGEGYFKYIVDRINPENQFYVNGFLFSFKMDL